MTVPRAEGSKPLLVSKARQRAQEFWDSLDFLDPPDVPKEEKGDGRVPE